MDPALSGFIAVHRSEGRPGDPTAVGWICPLTCCSDGRPTDVGCAVSSLLVTWLKWFLGAHARDCEEAYVSLRMALVFHSKTFLIAQRFECEARIAFADLNINQALLGAVSESTFLFPHGAGGWTRSESAFQPWYRMISVSEAFRLERW